MDWLMPSKCPDILKCPCHIVILGPISRWFFLQEPSEHEKWLQHRAQSHWKPNMDMTVAEIRAECFFTRSWGSDYTAEFVDLFRPKSRRRFPPISRSPVKKEAGTHVLVSHSYPCTVLYRTISQYHFTVPFHRTSSTCVSSSAFSLSSTQFRTLINQEFILGTKKTLTHTLLSTISFILMPC